MGAKTGSFFTDEEIRDTDSHDAAHISGMYYDSILVVTQNGLNQSCTINFEGSFDGTTWHEIATQAVAADGDDVRTLTDPWPRIRVTAQCGVAPTTGALSVRWAGRRSQ